MEMNTAPVVESGLRSTMNPHTMIEDTSARRFLPVVAENSVRSNFVALVTCARPSSCRGPLVSMVESSHLRELDHLAQLRPLDPSRLRGIAGQ